MKKFFIADTHFFHERLLGSSDFAPRPYESIEEMHQVMIASWNAVVTEKDTVYHLGDVAMHPDYDKGSQDILDILRQLQGKIVFIKGNHDSRNFFNFLDTHDPKLANGEAKFAFEDVGAIVKFNHHQYYLTHYPMLLGQTVNIRNLHGHIHHYSVPIADDINVGVDAPERDFLSQPIPFGTPLTENQIDEIAEKKAQELAKIRDAGV
ncbi:metallophosphoesterase [Enterococcus sp. HY326]|uniref:metallophosphoesterase n=1 Tax=Enterococcus sp. HY326 TaxID=2971265 RepID=UPI00223F4AD2|nr:metallophosphoesterase [Enterococcus sp. HY326]